MCMRFWDENTRELNESVRKLFWARAFHPKARSHAPITTPRAVGDGVLAYLTFPPIIAAHE
jgi:hypothetical protein